MTLTEDLCQLCCSSNTITLSFKNKQEGKSRKSTQLLQFVAVKVEQKTKMYTHGRNLNPEDTASWFSKWASILDSLQHTFTSN
jgi:hypothetical protein